MSSNNKVKINNIILLCVILFSFIIFIWLILFINYDKVGDHRSAGFSEPIKESQVLELSIMSNFMEREMPCMIYLPKGYGNGVEYPVWYGLNGYNSDETMWIDNGVAEVADELINKGEIEPMIMVFPYTKDATLKEITKDFEDDGKFDERNIDKFISKELVSYIDSHYYTKPSAKDRYIGGFSMGGMIALRIAFHHTDMFSKVGGYSAAVLSNDYSDRQLEKWLFPNDHVDQIEDIIEFDKEKGFDKLHIYLDAGNSNDPFSVGLQSLYDALQKRGVTSEFELYNGGHTLRKDSISDYLKFYAGKD
ncbi:esterase family protein [Mobilitalea sibirica]|uniref:Esterase family protein n=1 Tax=Mobilitalea sibirica TaxID=1462919 RepID=A0A8J7H1T2_9FIRM|nr:alpha/beta hydrolase-fold protein [Mobilitalea sibirica]MBH1940260.1 esterase family protein [Mobilitalea sibirica]